MTTSATAPERKTLGEEDVGNLHLEGKPFHVISLPDQEKKTGFMRQVLLQFEDASEPQIFELNNDTVVALNPPEVRPENQWQFHFDDEEHLSIIPYTD